MSCTTYKIVLNSDSPFVKSTYIADIWEFPHPPLKGPFYVTPCAPFPTFVPFQLASELVPVFSK